MDLWRVFALLIAPILAWLALAAIFLLCYHLAYHLEGATPW